jgi:hypothetical protein
MAPSSPRGVVTPAPSNPGGSGQGRPTPGQVNNPGNGPSSSAAPPPDGNGAASFPAFGVGSVVGLAALTGFLAVLL